VKRREFIRLLAGAAAWASIAVAQQRKVGLPLIGALWPGRPSAPITVSHLQAFREGLRGEGYVEDQNVRLENRYAEGVDGMEKAAAELTSLDRRTVPLPRAGVTPTRHAVGPNTELRCIDAAAAPPPPHQAFALSRQMIPVELGCL